MPSARSRITTACSYSRVLPSFPSSSPNFRVVCCCLTAGGLCHCFSPAVPILQTLGCTRATIASTSTTPSTAPPPRRPYSLRRSPFLPWPHPTAHYGPGPGRALGRAHGSASAGAGTVPQTATGTVLRIGREETGATPRTVIVIGTGTGTGTGRGPAAAAVAAAEATAAATKRRMAGATEVKSASRWTLSAPPV